MAHQTRRTAFTKEGHVIGSRDGAVVRALASHQCGPGSIPGLGIICGLSLLLVLVPAPRVFSGFSGFPPSTKTNISKLQFDLETVDGRATPWIPLKFLFIFFIYVPVTKIFDNRPFPSCFEPHYESEAKCKVFVMKISCHSYANKTNFHMKSFVLSLAFIVRFTATRKWPI